MVLKNLFTGQQWRNRHREQTSGHGKRGGEGEMFKKKCRRKKDRKTAYSKGENIC